MKKVLIPLIIILFAGVNIYSQGIDINTKLKLRSGETTINEIDAKHLDSIKFQQLSGAPTCEIALPAMQNTISRKLIGQSYSITVSYSGEMNQNFKPTIAFAPTATANTLSQKSESWDDNYNYTWTYEVKDVNQQRIEPTITVNGARDKNGNLQNPCSLSNTLIIDTETPSISTITFPSYLKICDNNVGDEYPIKLKFTEEMKTGVKPVIKFSPANTIGNVFDTQYEEGWEADNRTYIYNFKVVDKNVNIATITAFAYAAVDKVGNEMDTVDIDKVLSVDTQNPKVSALSATIPNIKLEHINSTVVFTVSFNEVMKAAPKLEFSSDLSKVLSLQKTYSVYPYNTFRYEYKVLPGFNQNLTAVDIKVRKGTDSCDNEQEDYTKADYLNILMSITEIFREGFATYVTGSPVYFPWTRSSNGVANEIDNSYFTSDSVSLMTEGSFADTKTESVYRDFTATTDEINVEFCLRTDSESDSASIALVHRATGEVSCAFIIARDGKAYLRSGNTSEVITWPSDNPYVGNLFSCYRMNYNKLTGVASLYYNNVLAKTVTATVPTNLYNSIFLNTFEGVVHWDTLILWY